METILNKIKENSHQYDHFTKLIQTPSFLNMVTKTLKEEKLVLHPRIFCSLFFMHYFPKITFSEPLNPIDKRMINMLSRVPEIINFTTPITQEYLLNFQKLFKEWKNADLFVIIDTYGKSWAELTNLENNIIKDPFEPNTNSDILDCILKQKSRIIQDVEKIGGKSAVAKVRSYVPICIDLPALSNMIKDHYWDSCSKRFKENDFEEFYCQLNVVLTKFISLVPNRKDLHSEFIEKIDVGFIKQQVENGAFSKLDCIDLFNYLKNWLSKMISADMDTEFNIKVTNLDKIIEETESFNIILVEVMKFILKQLTEIEERIVEISRNVSDKKND